MTRIGKIDRTTRESTVSVEVDLDGTGQVGVATGVPFYDNMLTSFGVHSSLDLRGLSDGDVDVDAHRAVVDTAIVLGQAVREARGDKSGIQRFGDALVPMDESLAHAAVDVSGRPYCLHVGEP